MVRFKISSLRLQSNIIEYKVENHLYRLYIFRWEAGKVQMP